MGAVGQKERKTQQRVVALFRERLGYAAIAPGANVPTTNAPGRD